MSLATLPLSQQRPDPRLKLSKQTLQVPSVSNLAQFVYKEASDTVVRVPPILTYLSVVLSSHPSP